MKGLQTDIALAGRRFHAWWEGYAFDGPAERNRLARAHGLSASGASATYRPEDEIAQCIWGAGRLEPGGPVWTMRFARELGVSLRARVVVLGAGAGGPLRDLKTATRWKVSGFSRYLGTARGVDLKSYEQVMSRINKAAADGGISLFELHRDPDPRAFAAFAAELIAPGAPMIFVDFTVARKGRGLKSCFTSPWGGSPKPANDVTALLNEAGFRVVDTSDETRAFLPLIAQGWASWRTAYEEARTIKNVAERVAHLQVLSQYAHLWAERLDALKAGQLQVTRFQTRRNG
ncbi:MAG: hypothetical protein AAGJ73_15080 [Pseudomonadota bacterium]